MMRDEAWGTEGEMEPFFAQAKTVNKFFSILQNIRKTVPIGIDHGEIQISNWAKKYFWKTPQFSRSVLD